MYLIAHKVRGEPVFDIAEKLQIGDEEDWIIPTSGHRAYPYWWCETERLHTWIAPEGQLKAGWAADILSAMPPDLPDHYSVNDAPKPRGQGLLAKLGLAKPKEPFNRRL